MRKTVFTIAALSLASLASGSAAWAADSQGQQEQGTFIKGTLGVLAVVGRSCAPGDSACSTCVSQDPNNLFVEAQGIAETTLGPLFAQVLKCASSSPAPYGGYMGTLTLSATPTVAPPNGTANFPLGNQPGWEAYSLLAPPEDALLLAYSGKNDDNGDFYGFAPFEGTLTVESGIGKFKGAHGKLTFIAQGPSPINASLFGTTPSTSPFSGAGNAFYLFEGTIQGISQ